MNTETTGDETIESRDECSFWRRHRVSFYLASGVVAGLALSIFVCGVGGIGAQSESRVRIAMRVVSQLEGLIDAYKLRNSPARLPDSLDELTQGPSPLTKEIKPDPWGNDYVYYRLDDERYVLFSKGPDGKAGTEDDIVNER